MADIDDKWFIELQPSQILKGRAAALAALDARVDALETNPGGGGPFGLDDASDVDTSSSPPDDLDVLSWDDSSQLWIPLTLGDLGFLDTITLALITDAGALAELDTVGSAQIDTDAVGADELANNTVSLAHMVAGTPNTLVGYDASGDPVEIAGDGSTVTISAGVISSAGGSVPTPATATISAISHVLAANQRDHLNVLLLTPSSANDFVVIVPDNAAAADRWRLRSRTTGSVHVHRAASTLAYDNLSGTFSVGETITGGTSGATATAVADTGSVLSLVMVSGTFQDNEGLTGGTSGATALVNGTITDSTGTVNGAAFKTVEGVGKEAKIEVESNAGTSPVITIEGETTEATTSEANHDMGGFDLLNIGATSTFETPSATRAALGAAPAAGPVFTGLVDVGGAGIEAPNGAAVSGTLTKATHGGGVFPTSGNVTITPAAGFSVTLKLGGAHTVGAGGAAHTGATGDVVTVVCWSDSDVDLFQTTAANVVDLPTS